MFACLSVIPPISAHSKQQFARTMSEAGKGFAVVADEIKELARQTADATLEIKTQIEGIQHSTSRTVLEIENIPKSSMK